jgi:hypothetical protein
VTQFPLHTYVHPVDHVDPRLQKCRTVFQRATGVALMSDSYCDIPFASHGMQGIPALKVAFVHGTRLALSLGIQDQYSVTCQGFCAITV